MNQLAKATPSDLAKTGLGSSEFFDDSVVKDQSDILIPKLLLMQGTSQAVGDEKAEQGSIVSSITLETLAKKNELLEIIPIKQMNKTWVVERYDADEERYLFLRQEPWKPADANLPWEFEEDGAKCRRSGCLNFFVLVADQIKNDAYTPHMISFRRTSAKTGKQLQTYFEFARGAYEKAVMKGLPEEQKMKHIPMGQVLSLRSKIAKGNGNAWYVFDIEGDKQRLATAEERVAGMEWFTSLKNMGSSLKVDESDLQQPEGPSEGDEGVATNF